MPKGSSKRPKREDSSQAARRVVDTVIERSEADAEPEIEITPEMRAAAAAFGRIGGKIGGIRRAEKLSANRRSEIAKKAAASRWSKR
jgi:hypothetical protein